MSVPVPKRSKSDLDLFIKAKKLTKYTLTITSNQNVFFPQYSRLIDEINQLSIDIFVDLWTANNLNLFTRSEERLNFQNKAIAKCIRLLAIIDVAQKVFHLSLRSVAYWGNIIIQIRNLTRAWKNSDNKRKGK